MLTSIGRHRATWIAAAIACVFATTAWGADSDQRTVQKVVASLKDPRGVAVRPDGAATVYEIFVAEGGAGRIVKIRSDQPEKTTDAITGFSTKAGSSKPGGIYSIQFLDHMRLVAAGGDEEGAPFVRLYELPEPEAPVTADRFKHEAGVPEGEKPASFKPVIFRSIARTQPNERVGDFILAVAPSEGEPAGMVYVPIRAGSLGDSVLASFPAGAGDFEIGAMSVGKNGYVTAATNPAAEPGQPSQIAFFSPLDRRIVMQLSTQLKRISAIAYSPKTGNLYVASAVASGDMPAGVYRIDRDESRGTSTTAVKIAEVRNPTALAFSPDGTLYVTSTDDKAEGGAGSLWKLSGNL